MQTRHKFGEFLAFTRLVPMKDSFFRLNNPQVDVSWSTLSWYKGKLFLAQSALHFDCKWRTSMQFAKQNCLHHCQESIWHITVWRCEGSLKRWQSRERRRRVLDAEPEAGCYKARGAMMRRRIPGLQFIKTRRGSVSRFCQAIVDSESGLPPPLPPPLARLLRCAPLCPVVSLPELSLWATCMKTD